MTELRSDSHASWLGRSGLPGYHGGAKGYRPDYSGAGGQGPSGIWGWNPEAVYKKPL